MLYHLSYRGLVLWVRIRTDDLPDVKGGKAGSLPFDEERLRTLYR